MKSQFFICLLVTSCISITSCKTETKTGEEAPPVKEIVYDTSSPKDMLLAVAEASGGMDNLKKLNDVEFDYHYLSADGKKDISKERYIFANEVSWAKYSTHEVNAAPGLEGDFVQFYDGKKAFAYSNGEAVSDAQNIGTSQFLRQANYMWFTMMYKITDPGIISSYEGTEEVDGKTYDLVNVSYDPAVTGKEQNDTYILYIDPETHMVDQFKFSLPAFNVVEPVLLAKVTYTEMEGIKVISRREMFAPSPEDGTYGPLVDQQIKNVKFNNGFTAEGLSQEM